MNKPPKPLRTEVIASPKDFIPSSQYMEIVGAFNPGVTTIQTPNGLETLLMIRVAEKYKGDERDDIHLPFFEIPNQESISPIMGFDMYPRKKVVVNKKDVILPPDGEKGEIIHRLRHISLPRIMRINEKGGIKREQEPALCPSWEYERFGMEDFRITSLDGRYLLTYVVPHRDFGVSTIILETKNFDNYKSLTEKNTPRPIKTGIKDMVIFPEKVQSPSSTKILKEGEKIYASLIRPNAYVDVSVPGIWISYSPDLVHWGQEHRLTTKIITGTGPPPIKLGNIWLAPYHETTRLNEETKYDTKLMSINAKEPWKDFHSSDVLLTREDYYEILPEKGYVPNVIFTSGMIEREGITSLFSGIDDTYTVQDDFYTEDLIKFVNGK